MAVRIGYLGPGGTFTEEAMHIYASKKENYIKVEFTSIPGMIHALFEKIDEAVVPIENSIEGSVNITIDLLIHESKALIKGELVLPVNQHLFAKKYYSFEEIKEVYSHPQALYQCRGFLYNKLPGVLLKETASTAEAALIVASSERPIAAIGGRRLGELYNLVTLSENIQDCRENLTRFIVLSGEDCKPTGNDKTSMVFATENRPGSLYRILGLFARENLNLSKIESRPSRRALGEYIFFLEVEAHKFDKSLRKVLQELKRNTTFFKLLGSYPRWQGIYPPGRGELYTVKTHLDNM